MSLGAQLHKLRLRYEVPPLPRLNTWEKAGLLAGTGLGCGFIKPAAPSWASIPGFAIFILAARLPLAAGLGLYALLIAIAVWSGSVSERLLGLKDPRPVVIDEIAAVPFALWPLLLEWPRHFLTWIVLFAAYRFMDFIKPFPANRLQSVRGGLGILLDDVISSVYMGVAVWFWIHYFPKAL